MQTYVGTAAIGCPSRSSMVQEHELCRNTSRLLFEWLARW